MKRAILLLVMVLLFAPQAHAAALIGWDELKDPAAQFDDPFEALSGRELRSLGTVLQLRRRLGAPDVPPSERPQLEAELRREEAKLAASGVRTDWLLSHRRDIARKRAAAAMAGNAALEGREIAIKGYVIPVQDPGGAVTSGYLVPEQGMCSHMPAPDPNQMVRYRVSGKWQGEYIYEPVVMTGRLSLQMTRQEITLLDGRVDMIAAFEMEVTGGSKP
ncbi:DUF3299 domain-containing protein [Roseibium salinum]|nr:DUF3299 domain-containing protein [Roseibium salinum]